MVTRNQLIATTHKGARVTLVIDNAGTSVNVMMAGSMRAITDKITQIIVDNTASERDVTLRYLFQGSPVTQTVSAGVSQTFNTGAASYSDISQVSVS